MYPMCDNIAGDLGHPLRTGQKTGFPRLDAFAAATPDARQAATHACRKPDNHPTRCRIRNPRQHKAIHYNSTSYKMARFSQ